MNPTKAKVEQDEAGFSVTHGWNVGLFHPTGGPVRAAEHVPNGGTSNADGITTIPLPDTLFDGVVTGSYRVGVQPANNGGPGPWALSAPHDIIGEPGAVGTVTLE